MIWYKASHRVSDVLWWQTIKSTQRRLAATNASESILISILYFIGLIPWPEYQRKKKRGRPYVYPPTVILRCFVVRIWLRFDSNRALHDFLAMDYYPYNRKIMKACGLTSLPDRRTFDRRLKTISADTKERIAAMVVLFVKENFVDPYIVTIDSTLLRAKGHLWHKSSMIEGGTSFRYRYWCKVGIQPHQGMDIWVQAAYNSKYWFSCSTIISRFYSGWRTR